jgi:hypothetical protein
VVDGIPLVVGTAVAAGRVVAVTVGTGVVVEESTSTDPERPQPARAQPASSTASTVPVQRPLPNRTSRLYPGFPPGRLSSRP